MEAVDHEGDFVGVVEAEEERRHYKYLDDGLDELGEDAAKLEEDEDVASLLEDRAVRHNANEEVEDDEEEHSEDGDKDEGRQSDTDGRGGAAAEESNASG